MANEHTVSWVNPAKRSDGSKYDTSQHAGYMITVKGQGTVLRIPVSGWQTKADLSINAGFAALKAGNYQLTVAAIDKQGAESEPSAVSNITVSPPPSAPSGVSVS